MNSWWPLGGLLAVVATLLWMNRGAAWQRIFRWLPLPLWCYAIPMVAVTIGLLPREHPAYQNLSDQLLPFALALLLLGVNLPSVLKVGSRALVAFAIGALSIAGASVCGIWLFKSHLPIDAWKGAGTLAATWTGGSTNLLALRGLLETPDEIFAPLIVVDAVIAYSWMAILVAASAFQDSVNRWFHAPTPDELKPPSTTDLMSGHAAKPAYELTPEDACSQRLKQHRLPLLGSVCLALVLVASMRYLARFMPMGQIISSERSWVILLVTSVSLCLSLIRAVRRIGQSGERIGYPCLYVVLAATGAQASLQALCATPLWIALGLFIVIAHGMTLLVAGKLLRLPLGIIATASQANIGGFVSGPLVGAIYHRSLAPVGLLLAMVGNALGTYSGFVTALLARMLTQI